MNRFTNRFRHLLGTGVLALAVMPAHAALVDFQGEVTNPNNTIGAGNTGNMIGNGSFGWQTGTTSIDVITNGFDFTLDSGNGNAFNYGGSISGDSDVNFRMAPYWSGLRDDAMIISGATPNTYTGTSFIGYGHVSLQKTPGVNAIAGNVVIGGQGDNDRLSLGANDQIADTSMIAFRGTETATFNVNGFTETVGAVRLAPNAAVNLGAGGALTVAAVNNTDGTWLAAGDYVGGSLPFLTGDGSVKVLSDGAGLAGNSIGLNFAGSDNSPGGRKVIAPGEFAGAPGYAQQNWNNTPGTGQVGTPSASNDTLLNLIDNNGFNSTADVTFTSAQVWGFDWGSNPTGDQQINGNGITDGNPRVNVSEIPFSQYDVVVYVGNYDGAGATVDTSVTLTDAFGATYERFVSIPFWGDFVDWDEISEGAVSADLRELGNYMVFTGLTGNTFEISLNGRGGINAIQIVGPAFVAVPEPATALLLGLASCGLAMIRRSRREGAMA